MMESKIVLYGNFSSLPSRSVQDLIEKYKRLTVADLKKEMKKVGLKPRGLKRDLVKQLAEKHFEERVLHFRYC